MFELLFIISAMTAINCCTIKTISHTYLIKFICLFMYYFHHRYPTVDEVHYLATIVLLINHDLSHSLYMIYIYVSNNTILMAVTWHDPSNICTFQTLTCIKKASAWNVCCPFRVSPHASDIADFSFRVFICPLSLKIPVCLHKSTLSLLGLLFLSHCSSLSAPVSRHKIKCRHEVHMDTSNPLVRAEHLNAPSTQRNL